MDTNFSLSLMLTIGVLLIAALVAFRLTTRYLRKRRLKRPDLEKLLAASDASPEALWQAVSAVLSWHNKKGDLPIHTLNRLWRSSPCVEQPDSLPVLTESQLFVSLETWELERLAGLLHAKLRTELEPRSVTSPIIVLRWSGMDYLIDGRRRVNYWERTRREGPYRVLVIQGRQMRE